MRIKTKAAAGDARKLGWPGGVERRRPSRLPTQGTRSPLVLALMMSLLSVLILLLSLLRFIFLMLSRSRGHTIRHCCSPEPCAGVAILSKPAWTTLTSLTRYRTKTRISRKHCSWLLDIKMRASQYGDVDDRAGTTVLPVLDQQLACSTLKLRVMVSC